MEKFKNKILAVFGDSIIDGAGNNRFGIGEYLKRELGFKLLKYCVGGARTGYCEGKSWIVEQVRKAVFDKIYPDFIVFDGFTNDCCTDEMGACNVPLGEIAEGFDGFDIFKVLKESTTFSYCFENILSAFRTYFPKSEVLFVRPHKMGRRGEEVQKLYGERAVALCKKWGVKVADIYADSDMNTFLKEHRDLYTADTYGWGCGDCTHPNARGYEEKYLKIIIEELKK